MGGRAGRIAQPPVTCLSHLVAVATRQVYDRLINCLIGSTMSSIGRDQLSPAAAAAAAAAARSRDDKEFTHQRRRRPVRIG